MKIQIDGIAELNEKLDELADNERMKNALTRSGELVRDRARTKCPVRKPKGGHLRRSINYTVEGDSALVGTSVKYAPYVEFGTGSLGDPSVPHTDKKQWTYYSKTLKQFVTTSGQEKHPYLVPALKDSTKEIADIFKEEFGK